MIEIPQGSIFVIVGVGMLLAACTQSRRPLFQLQLGQYLMVTLAASLVIWTGILHVLPKERWFLAFIDTTILAALLLVFGNMIGRAVIKLIRR